MDIAPILEISRGVTALIGGGGKTTLMETLAGELRRQGTVIVATSTRIMRPHWCPVLLTAEVGQVTAALAAHGVACVASPSDAPHKLTAPDMGFETLAALADFVLVEADGARRLPLKAHAPYEPVIPACAVRTIYVVGADGFGRPIREVCHRPEWYAALCGAVPDAPVTPAMEARVLLAEGYGSGWVYVNKVETDRDWVNAAALSAALPAPLLAGSLHRREYRML